MSSYIFEAIEYKKKCLANVFVTSIENSNFHWHYEYELILVLKGTLSVSTGSKSFIMGAGDIFLVNSKIFHKLHSTQEKNICLFIQINKHLFSDFKDVNKIYYFYLNSKEEEVGPKTDYSKFVNLAASIGLEFQKEDIIGFYRSKSMLYMLISNLFEYVIYDIHQISAVSKENEDVDTLMKIFEFIQDNYKKETVLDELYRRMGMSEKTMHRFLKNNVGLSIKELLIGIRIDASKTLLKYSDSLISYIVDECGFGSENTFYRAFKKSVGVTPNEYRMNGAILENNPVVKGYLSFNQKEATNLLKKYI